MGPLGVAYPLAAADIFRPGAQSAHALPRKLETRQLEHQNYSQIIDRRIGVSPQLLDKAPPINSRVLIEIRRDGPVEFPELIQQRVATIAMSRTCVQHPL